MGGMVRLMPNHDPNWKERLEAARARQAELLGREGILTESEQSQLMALRQEADRAFNARFRTTAEYRDFYVGRARDLLEEEGIDMPIPALADDATLEEIDRVLAMVWQAVEVTNSETF